MAESRTHMDLVMMGVNYIKTIVGNDYAPLIQFDSPDSKRPTKVIKEFIPDIYFWHENTLIIGEAKTINDFDRPHSISQYEAYVEECKSFIGESLLVICVPWQILASAKNYFRRLKKNYDCENMKVLIIDEFGKVFEV